MILKGQNMKISIVVDANIIISALLGGVTAGVFFKGTFIFITSDFTIKEIEKYVLELSKKLGVSEDKLRSALELLPLKVVERREYESFLSKAAQMIKDPKDVPILALALSLNLPLWTNDKHFDIVKEILIIKTKDLV